MLPFVCARETERQGRRLAQTALVSQSASGGRSAKCGELLFLTGLWESWGVEWARDGRVICCKPLVLVEFLLAMLLLLQKYLKYFKSYYPLLAESK